MKKIGFIISLLISNLSFAQVGIGTNNLDAGVILDFETTSNKGIILPKVNINLSQTFTNGTILMDKEDKRIKIYENGKWLILSDEGSFTQQLDPETNNPVTTAAVINSSDEVNTGVIISTENLAPSEEPEGVLVLESNHLAMVLPKVANPHLTIQSPVAGTICYDTVSKSLAVFDGKVWNFWK